MKKQKEKGNPLWRWSEGDRTVCGTMTGTERSGGIKYEDATHTIKRLSDRVKYDNRDKNYRRPRNRRKRNIGKIG